MRHPKTRKQKLILALDSHRISAFELCPMKDKYENVEQLTPRAVSTAFKKGANVHKVLEHYWRGKQYQKRFGLTDTQCIQLGQNVLRRHFSKLYAAASTKKEQALVQEEWQFHLSKYMEYVSVHQKQKWEVLGTEVGFSVVLYEDPDVIFILEGRIDMIIRNQARPASWVDFKTQSREYKLYKNANQFCAYSWVLSQQFGIHNGAYGFLDYYGLQKSKEGTEAFVTDSVFYTPEYLAEWRREKIQTYRHILACRLSNSFEKRRTACDFGKFGWCPYIRLCDNDTAPREVQASLRKIYYKQEKPWSPWESSFRILK